MRVLDGKRISYQSHTYEPDATLTGEEIAGLLGENPEKVFKTLVARGKSGTCFVFLMLRMVLKLWKHCIDTKMK